MQMANASSARDFQEQLNALRETEGNWWVRQTSIGDAAGWRQFLNEPESRAKPEFKEYQRAFDALGVEHKVAEFTATSREITAMLDRLLGRGNVPEAPDETKPLIAQQLNQAFARQNMLGAPLFEARFVPVSPPIGPTSTYGAAGPGVALIGAILGKMDKKIRFFDEQGNEVDENTIALMTSTPMANVLQPRPQPVPQDTTRTPQGTPGRREETPEEIAARIRAKSR